MTQQPDKEFERWAREHDEGNLSSPTTRQLYEHRHLTVEEYIQDLRIDPKCRVRIAHAFATYSAQSYSLRKAKGI